MVDIYNNKNNKSTVIQYKNGPKLLSGTLHYT